MFILFLLVAAVVLGFNFYAGKKRAEQAALTANTLGLTYARGDVVGLLRSGHEFFRKGDKQEIRHTVYGDYKGHRVVLVDFISINVSTNAQGQRSESRHPYSVALAEFDTRFPALGISPEGLGQKLFNTVGVSRDVQFESEAFNRTFKVKSTDERFPYVVIDAAMIDHLMSKQVGAHFELLGTDVLLISEKLDWSQMASLLEQLLDFCDHIGRLAWEDYAGSK